MATASSLSKRASAGTPLNRPVALAKKRRAAELKEAADKVFCLSTNYCVYVLSELLHYYYYNLCIGLAYCCYTCSSCHL